MEDTTANSNRCNVLSLDGGGVRGLSSLLILQALMAAINLHVRSLHPESSKLHPYHVFQLVGGTSTGGLIGLMLSKMGMMVEECISQYEDLSKIIFGKTHLRGRLTLGFGTARYSGKRLQKCIRDSLLSRHLDENMAMKHNPQSDKMACTVICREHTSSQYSKLKPRAVPLCSLPCDYNIDCLVSDAARATSAAPTFFPSKCINDRLLVDGGLGHNNPSFDIFYHYHRLRTKNMIDERNKVPRICDKIKTAPMFSTHGDLDCSRLRFTNIGTGVKIDEDEPDKHGRLARLVPGAIKNVIFLVQTLKDTAVSSESTADIMRILSYVDDGLEYERFDATYGVSKIKLDDHNALDDIRAKTKTYLGQQDTKEHLDKVAFSIATDYVNTLAPATCGPLVEIQPTVSNSTAPIQVTQEPISRLILSTESSGSSTAVKGHPHRGLHVQFTSGDNPRGSRPASSVETHVPDSSAQSTVSQDEHGVSGLGLETH